MKIKALLSCAVFLAVAGVSGAASAEPGFSNSTMNLRAGPGPQYPVIATVPPNVDLDINGCVGGWRWCDVDMGDLHGWVSGRHLESDYNDQPVSIYQYGSTLGLPIVVFDQDEYWGRYYSNRPFYRDYVVQHPRPVQHRYFSGVDRNEGHYHDHDNDYNRNNNVHSAPVQHSAPAPHGHTHAQQHAAPHTNVQHAPAAQQHAAPAQHAAAPAHGGGGDHQDHH